MRSALILTLSLFCAGISWAQSAAPAKSASAPQKSSAPAEKGSVEQRTERIRVEDEGSRIDELRIGGETKTIDVQPKGGMPAYQVQPANGERSWKILGF